METIRVSVIIPVYNVEPYLDRFIQALENQGQSGLEFIFIEDGSTDRSMEIVEAFAQRDPRVQIFYNEENLGAGPTRNIGIRHAKGDYLSFVDPDDWMADDFYSLLVEKADQEGLDIVKGTAVLVNDKTKRPIWERVKLNNTIKTGLQEGKPLYCLFTYEHWTAIYARHLFGDPQVCYGTSRVSQDTTFQLKACKQAKSFGFEERALYYYRKEREGSNTYRLNIVRSLSEIDALQEKINYLNEKEMDAYDYEYLKDQIHLLMKNYSLNYSSANIDDSLHSFYVNCLRQTVLSIHNADRLIQEDPWIRDLVEKQVVSCPMKVFLFGEASLMKTNPTPERVLNFPKKMGKFLYSRHVSSVDPVAEEDQLSLSVIIPVYNAHAYLSECFRNLMNQQKTDIEYIFVDDASTDSTVEMIRTFIQDKPNMHLICQEMNQGAGAARNRGMDVAQGEYIGFLDVDDWPAPDLYARLATRAIETRADVVKGTEVMVDEEGNVLNNGRSMNRLIQDGQEKGEPLYLNFTHEFFTAIYKKSWLEENHIRFQTTYHGEDTTFLLEVGTNTENIAFAQGANYFYVRTPQSMTLQHTQFRTEQLLKSFQAKIDYLKERSTDRYTNLYYENKIQYTLQEFFLGQKESNEDIEHFTEELLACIKTIPGFDPPPFPKEIEVLVKEGFAIPLGYRNSPPFIWEIAMERWTDYLLQTEDPDQESVNRYAYAFFRYVAIATVERSDRKPLLRQFDRLSSSVKRRVVLQCMRETDGFVKRRIRKEKV